MGQAKTSPRDKRKHSPTNSPIRRHPSPPCASLPTPPFPAFLTLDAQRSQHDAAFSSPLGPSCFVLPVSTGQTTLSKSTHPRKRNYGRFKRRRRNFGNCGYRVWQSSGLRGLRLRPRRRGSIRGKVRNEVRGRNWAGMFYRGSGLHELFDSWGH